MKEIKEFLKDMWDYFIDDIFPVIGTISLIILFIFGVAKFQYEAHEWKCEMKATAQGMEWSYGLGKGCMVRTENGWMDYNRLIYTKGAK